MAGVAVVTRPELVTTNSYYIANRPPLTPSPFVKLPIGSITPRGWLRHQLELEKDGMTGRLKEVSPWLNFEKSSWGNKEGKGDYGWEELPYWLKGYGDLGYVLGDDAIIAEARKWIESAMESQREDGWFGPRELLTSLKGKPDLWPHMVMLNILQSYYEFSSDPRVLDVMTRYLKWENTLPVSAFGEGYWPKIRAGDNIESAFWLYNRTGEAWLLDLAKKIHQGMARWDTDVIDWHNVNLAQGSRAGTVAWMLSKNAVSVDHGPLSFSLAIKERWAKYGNRDANWPEWEVFPDSPWNYGLALDPAAPEKSFTVVRKPDPLSAQPFTPDTRRFSSKAKPARFPTGRWTASTSWIDSSPIP